MAVKRSAPTDASIAAQEKALLTRIERSKLEIAETEAELANFLSQRKQLDAEIAQAVGIERSKLQFARDVVADECEGSKLLLSEASAALQQAQVQLDALRAQQDLQPRLAARAAALTRAWGELLATADELLSLCREAEGRGLRCAIAGLAPGGGAVAPAQRIDLIPLRGVPLLAVDPNGAIRCTHAAVATARVDLVTQEAGQ